MDGDGSKRICTKKMRQKNVHHRKAAAQSIGGREAGKRQHPTYSKTAKLLIKNTYTVKSYLMDYVGDVNL